MLALLARPACLAPRRLRHAPLVPLRRMRVQKSARRASLGASRARRTGPRATPARLVAIARWAPPRSSRAKPAPLETQRASPHKLAATPAPRVTRARSAQQRPRRAPLAPSPQMGALASVKRVKREGTRAPLEQLRARRALVERSALRAQCRRRSAPPAPIQTPRATAGRVTAWTAHLAPSASPAPSCLSHALQEASAVLKEPRRVLFARPALTRKSRVQHPARCAGRATGARLGVSSGFRSRARVAPTSTLAVGNAWPVQRAASALAARRSRSCALEGASRPKRARRSVKRADRVHSKSPGVRQPARSACPATSAWKAPRHPCRASLAHTPTPPARPQKLIARM